MRNLIVGLGILAACGGCGGRTAEPRLAIGSEAIVDPTNPKDAVMFEPLEGQPADSPARGFPYLHAGDHVEVIRDDEPADKPLRRVVVKAKASLWDSDEGRHAGEVLGHIERQSLEPAPK